MLLAAVVLIVLASRNIFNFGNISRYISDLFSIGGRTGEYSYTYSDTNMFASVDGGLAIVSGSGLEYYDKLGETVIKEFFTMSSPVIVSNGRQGLIYEAGGATLKVFDSGGYILELKSEEAIISASLSENGWMAVVTRASGYKDSVTVYSLKNRSMEPVYTWYSGSAYVLDAAVSPDNKHMAALSFSESGSRVVLFDLKSEGELGSYSVSGSLLIDIEYLSENSIAAVSENSVLFMDGSAGYVNEYGYDGENLTNYASGGFAAIARSKYRYGNVGGSIVTLNEKGEILGSIETEGEILDIKVRGNYVTVLHPEGLTIYTKELTEYAVLAEAAGAENVVMAADKTAIVTYTYSAEVISY